MEPLAAVGLATNIIQLVQISKDITTTIKEIYKSSSGCSAETERFENLAKIVQKDLDVAFSKGPVLQLPSNEVTNYVETLRKEIDAFNDELRKLRSKRPSSVLQAGIVAVRTWWKRDHIENCARTINQMSNQIAAHIIMTLGPEMGGKLDQLISQSGRFESRLSKEVAELNGLVRQQNDKSKEGYALLQAFNGWSKKHDDFETQLGCLRALYFPEIQSREDHISKAHQETFKWVMYDDNCSRGNETTVLPKCALTTNKRKEYSLLSWLRQDDPHKNIFCIFGKPGAGKSTLMKFIAQHKRLRELIRTWSEPHEHLIVEYYFWRHGSSLQRSLGGLLRYILYQILKGFPSLIRDAFPAREWTHGGPQFAFSQDSLLDAIQNTIRAAANSNLHLFILIDGLDEFDSRNAPDLGDEVDEDELVRKLRILKSSQSTKICVSSRPHNTFDRAYGQNPSRYFRLHDLTRHDIKVYIQETLGQNEHFMKRAAEVEGCASLADEIADAADGVFL
ncbi:hypothetical protein FB567DRAFT_592098 [Paraphoma chrysanthemicola]|uniref:Nephrocystin 3-like N-terminal domain-containing protein n=1 Tax=Paraphoma chrysanthemicola TaxID=798071 RepID=A0A8K0VYZ7_9PLEO|nr:hypothetical protein FB567DRAFT_592098 [Paraphoma chrysanthemicola]